MGPVKLSLVVAAVGLLSVQGIPSIALRSGVDKVNVTLYHVNPKKYGNTVANMDTGDAMGDAFFQLRGVSLPIACADTSGRHYGNECTNPETVDSPDLTITKVLVEVVLPFNDTGYAMCNICLNGTVPMTNPPKKCTGDEYVCTCGRMGWGPTPAASQDCAVPVGRENPGSLFTKFPVPPGSPNYQFWQHNMATKLMAGEWYSTIATSEGVSWRLVETQKRIYASCHDDVMMGAVAKLGSPCFNACPQPTNQTSVCYISCFFDTLLGNGSGSSTTPTGGLSADEISNLWTAPFETCPDA